MAQGQIVLDGHPRQRMERNLATKLGKALYNSCAAIVETVFGWRRDDDQGRISTLCDVCRDKLRPGGRGGRLAA